LIDVTAEGIAVTSARPPASVVFAGRVRVGLPRTRDSTSEAVPAIFADVGDGQSGRSWRLEFDRDRCEGLDFDN
jgi:hypothetical protein